MVKTMVKAPDKRTERTCQALIGAIYSLLENYNLEEISVLKLCEEANVKRATFYLHFADINQFINYTLAKKFHEIFPSISQNEPLPTRNEYLNGLFERVFDFVAKNRAMLKLNLEKLNPSTLHELFYLEMRDEVINKVAELSASGYIFLVPAQILGEYYAGALTALINWWLLSETEITKKELADYFNLIIEKEYSISPV
jgi:AcrR family transcriptional regulator